ncbi:MAG: hypothetical protein ACI841_004226 [Planctomycetota bacterium]|jgi:hypothetical protein
MEQTRCEPDGHKRGVSEESTRSLAASSVVQERMRENGEASRGREHVVVFDSRWPARRARTDSVDAATEDSRAVASSVQKARGHVPSSRRSFLAYLLMGAIAAGLRRFQKGQVTPKEIVLWVADRGANRVYGLDDDLIVRSSVTHRAPVRLAARQGGGLWVVSARHGHSDGCHRLSALAADGALLSSTSFSGVSDLDSIGGFEALLVEPEANRGAGELWRLDASGYRIRILHRPGLQFVAGGKTGALAASATGELWRLTYAGRVAAERQLAGPILQIATGPCHGLWWVCSVDKLLAKEGGPAGGAVRPDPKGSEPGGIAEGSTHGERSMVSVRSRARGVWLDLVDDDLQSHHRGRLEARPTSLVPIPGVLAVWCVNEAWRSANRVVLDAKRVPRWLRARLSGQTDPGPARLSRSSRTADSTLLSRVDENSMHDQVGPTPGGSPKVAPAPDLGLAVEKRVDIGLYGLGLGVASALGRVRIVAPGALVTLEADGQRGPSQGGFQFLTDVAGCL